MDENLLEKNEVIARIEKAITLLEEVDDYYSKLVGEGGLVSSCDAKIDYWEHYLEFNPLLPKEVYRIAREIKKQRILRRKYKNDEFLIRLYKDNESKMQNNGYRKILLTQLYKTDTKQRNAKYSYDAYTNEERNLILGIEEG